MHSKILKILFHIQTVCKPIVSTNYLNAAKRIVERTIGYGDNELEYDENESEVVWTHITHKFYLAELKGGKSEKPTTCECIWAKLSQAKLYLRGKKVRDFLGLVETKLREKSVHISNTQINTNVPPVHAATTFEPGMEKLKHYCIHKNVFSSHKSEFREILLLNSIS